MYSDPLTLNTQLHEQLIHCSKTLKNVRNVDNTLKFITPLFPQLHQPMKHSLRRIRLCVCVCVSRERLST